MPLTVEVQNGAVVSMVASNGADITPYLDTFRAHATIESLFDLVDSAISSRVYKLEVQYDPRYGFPTSISIDPSRMIMDDQTGYYATNFEVLP
jgi:methionine aminopeptidase